MKKIQILCLFSILLCVGISGAYAQQQTVYEKKKLEIEKRYLKKIMFDQGKLTRRFESELNYINEGYISTMLAVAIMAYPIYAESLIKEFKQAERLKTAVDFNREKVKADKIFLENEKVYQVIEQMPVFPGGEGELLAYISKNLKYPVIAQENAIQGKVILRFVVSKTGQVDTVKAVEVVRSLDPACDKEAIRVVKSLPNFIPGKQNGVNVAVWYTLPVTFRLE